MPTTDDRWAALVDGCIERTGTREQAERYAGAARRVRPGARVETLTAEDAAARVAADSAARLFRFIGRA